MDGAVVEDELKKTQELLHRTIIQLIQTNQDSAPKTIEKIKTTNKTQSLKSHRDRNFPVIFSDAFEHWRAPKIWNKAYFRNQMAEAKVTVAMTPDGFADSIVGRHFVEPHQCQITMSEMLDWLSDPTGNVRYLQLQNGSLNLEFNELRDDVDADGLEWAKEALGQECLSNIWIGNHLSTTSLHHDPYENLYCQILGHKKFTLFPPQEFHLLNEESYESARYVPSDKDSNHLRLEENVPRSTIPWLNPGETADQLSRPFVVILEPGETLYLPALWFHQVEQIDNEEGMCVAVNYWYDMDYSSPLWANWKFTRKISMLANGRLRDVEKELEEEEDL